MGREIEWSTQITLPTFMVEKFKKLQLQAKIAIEMKEYENEIKWNQYMNNKVIQDLEMSLFQN